MDSLEEEYDLEDILRQCSASTRSDAGNYRQNLRKFIDYLRTVETLLTCNLKCITSGRRSNGPGGVLRRRPLAVRPLPAEAHA